MLRKTIAAIRTEERQRPMWKNFLQALVLLSLALMSALYSSGAGRAGRVFDAVASALFSLSVAFWVALRFVPRLARGVDWNWIPFGAKYRVTRDGWIYFGAVGIVVLAAVNTSNNLLYMVLSGLLAVLMLSELLSALNFRFVGFDVMLPSRSFVGAPFPYSVRIRNGKHIFPVLSVHAKLVAEGIESVDGFYFPLVGPSGQVTESGEGALCSRRGRHTIKKIRITSRYPFGFFSKERSYDVDAECITFPSISPLEQTSLANRDFLGSAERFERGPGSDLYTIRDYIPSDSARHVHWKASARTASLKTREYAAEASGRVTLAFDRYGSEGDESAFELLVSRTASLAFHLMRSGTEVSLASDEWQSHHGSSEAQLDSILTYLALVQMSATASLPDSDPRTGALMMSLRSSASSGLVAQ